MFVALNKQIYIKTRKCTGRDGALGVTCITLVMYCTKRGRGLSTLHLMTFLFKSFWRPDLSLVLFRYFPSDGTTAYLSDVSPTIL